MPKRRAGKAGATKRSEGRIANVGQKKPTKTGGKVVAKGKTKVTTKAGAKLKPSRSASESTKTRRVVSRRLVPTGAHGDPFRLMVADLAPMYRALFPAVRSAGTWDKNASTFSALINDAIVAEGSANEDKTRDAVDAFARRMINDGGGKASGSTKLGTSQFGVFAEILKKGSPFQVIWDCQAESHPQGASSRELADFYHAVVSQTIPYPKLVKNAKDWQASKNAQTRNDFIAGLRQVAASPGFSPSDDQLDGFAAILMQPGFILIAPFVNPANTY